MSFTPPTTLPSIQFLLAQQTSEDKKFTKGHNRGSRSVSSLPSELQNLSLNGPSFQGIPPSKDDSQIPKAQPSWMNGPPPSTASSSSSTTQYSSSIVHQHQHEHQHQHQHQQHEHHHQYHHHQRSISDMSTPPSSFSSINNFNHAPTPQVPVTTGISSSSPIQSSPPPHHNHQRQRHLSHRRAVSATTADHIRHTPPPSSSSTPPPPVPPLPFNQYRAHSNSPPENYLPFNNHNNSLSTDAFFMNRHNGKQDPGLSTSTTTTTNSVPIHTNPLVASSALPPTHDTNRVQQQTTHAVVNGMELPRDISGRYLCPFCQKAFSRPSSLRIHTYSHTKEKPFACPECPRQFSVQSNMRRHLRIHLIRNNNKTTF